MLTNSQERLQKSVPIKKMTRKMNKHCVSRMYVDEFTDLHAEVTYISARTGHELGLRRVALAATTCKYKRGRGTENLSRNHSTKDTR